MPSVAPAPRIESVRVLGAALLLVRFRNGEQRAYDCGPLLSHHQFRLLKEPALFRAVRVDAGGCGVSWNDQIDLSEYELWTNGKPVAGESLAASAPAPG